MWERNKILVLNLGFGHANGYAMTFFQVCWNVVKEDILNFFKYFHEEGMFERVCYFYYSYSQKVKGSECKRF